MSRYPSTSAGIAHASARPDPTTGSSSVGRPEARANFAVYRIALSLPKDTPGYAMTHGRPDLRLELFNRMDLADGTLLLDVRAIGPDVQHLLPLGRKAPHVLQVDVQSESDRSAVYRVKIQPPAVWSVLRRHRILTRFPLIIVDGWVRFETLAQAKQIRELVRDLTREVGPSRVEAVRQGSVSPSTLGLTASQMVVFRQALASGYFGSPRRISLTELAERLGRSKSTVSQQVALIQRKLAESALRLKWAPIDFPV